MHSLRLRRFVLVAIVTIACTTKPEVSTPTGNPSTVRAQADPDCAVTNTWQRVSPNVRVEYLVGGLLATNLRSVIANSTNKALWSLRGAAPQAQMTLVARRLDSGETLQFVGKPISIEDDNTGLPDWGPTYFAHVLFPSAGCWRISTADGNPADAITFWVARGAP